jgi:hypothetical protein
MPPRLRRQVLGKRLPNRRLYGVVLATAAAVEFCCFGVAHADANVQADPPFAFESHYTENGKKIAAVTFSLEEPKECSGNGCNKSGAAESVSEAGGGAIPQPGIERRNAGAAQIDRAMFVPVFSAANQALNNWMSNLMGRSGLQREMAAAAALQTAYGNYLKSNHAADEAQIKMQMDTYWKKGHFYSSAQFDAEEKELSELLVKMKKADFDSTDVRAVVIHAPAPDVEVDKAIRTQLAAPIKLYERIAVACGPNMMCEPTFYYNTNVYVSKYKDWAKANEAPNFERYCAMVEGKVDAATEIALSHYREVLDESLRYPQDGGAAAVKGGLLAKLAELRASLSESKPQSTTSRTARELGLDAVSLGNNAVQADDLATASATTEIAQAMLDIALGATPGVGFAKDVYEAITGKDLLRGEELSATERLLAAIGVLSLGISEEATGFQRAFQRISHGNNGEILDKQLSKVRSFKAETVNKLLEKKYGLKESPYRPGTRVYRYETIEDEWFVRVYKTNKEGAWVMRSNTIEGMSGNEIAKKFSLPEVPTHVTDVFVPKGTVIERGAANKAIFEGNSMVTYQYRIPDYEGITFFYSLPLPRFATEYLRAPPEPTLVPVAPPPPPPAHLRAPPSPSD